MGSFSNNLPKGALLDVKCMHAAAKLPVPLASLVSVKESLLAMAICTCSDQIASETSDIHASGNRQSNWQVSGAAS